MPEKVYINKQNMEPLKTIALKQGITASAVVNKLLIDVGVGNDDVKSIVLQIPRELLDNNKEELKAWLEHKSNGLVNLFYS